MYSPHCITGTSHPVHTSSEMLCLYWKTAAADLLERIGSGTGTGARRISDLWCWQSRAERQGACKAPPENECWSYPWSRLVWCLLGRMSPGFAMKDPTRTKFISPTLLFAFSGWLCLKASKEIDTHGFEMLSLTLNNLIQNKTAQVGEKVPLHSHTFPDQYLSCQGLSWSLLS